MEQQNEAFRLQSDEEMLICNYFRRPAPNEPYEELNAAGIIQHINGGKMGCGLTSKKVGAIMKRLKFTLVRKSTGNYYQVVKVHNGQQLPETDPETAVSEADSQQPQEGSLPF